MIKQQCLMMVLVSIFGLLGNSMANAEPDDIIASEKKTVRDNNGEVTVQLDWLDRPGEFALTIDYFGFLTQEGLANFFLEVNGTRREFLTMREELPDRTQRIRILSFQPLQKRAKAGPNMLKKLPSNTLVDHLLFTNAPYYSQLGNVRIELKFFIHGRWDGDGNQNDGNFRFEFANTRLAELTDHF